MCQLPNLQATLPNFPLEVLEDWLMPYAQTEGWPPISTENGDLEGRWRYLLRRKPLSYWRSLRWSKIERHLSLSELTLECQDIMLQMALGAVRGDQNLYSLSIPDLRARFDRIVEYFGEYGVFPKPPSLIQDPNGLSVADGNHRLAAYFYCYGCFTFDPPDNITLNTKETQQFWLGET